MDRPWLLDAFEQDGESQRDLLPFTVTPISTKLVNPAVFTVYVLVLLSWSDRVTRPFIALLPVQVCTLPFVTKEDGLYCRYVQSLGSPDEDRFRCHPDI